MWSSAFCVLLENKSSNEIAPRVLGDCMEMWGYIYEICHSWSEGWLGLDAGNLTDRVTWEVCVIGIRYARKLRVGNKRDVPNALVRLPIPEGAWLQLLVFWERGESLFWQMDGSIQRFSLIFHLRASLEKIVLSRSSYIKPVLGSWPWMKEVYFFNGSWTHSNVLKPFSRTR